MPIFTFRFDLYGQPNGQDEADFPDQATAIAAARQELERRVDGIKAGVAVAQGAASTEDVEWLGRWDWSARDGSLWRPDGSRPVL
jgi:hypothetical protein